MGLALESRAMVNTMAFVSEGWAEITEGASNLWLWGCIEVVGCVSNRHVVSSNHSTPVDGNQQGLVRTGQVNS